MKKLLTVMSILFCLTILGKDLNIVGIEDANLGLKYNQKELMRVVSRQNAKINNAQKKLQYFNKADKSIKLKIIEQYQQAMDYQQINLDKLRKALQ